MSGNIKLISLTTGAFTNQYNGCGRGWVEFSGKTEKSRPVWMRYADTLDNKGSDRQDGYAECVDEDGYFTDGGGEKVQALQRPGARRIIGGKLRVYGNFSCWSFFYYSPILL